MFLGHFAVGLAGRRVTPAASLAAWIAAVQLVDLIWPIFLLLGLEHVRIAPGITAFTPLDFYDYPITHSLVGGVGWAALFAGLWYWRTRAARTALFLAAGVLSHWVLDVIAHRPDVPVLPHGPYVGLGLWYSVPATLAVELTMFAAAILYIWRDRAEVTRRGSFLGTRRVPRSRVLRRRFRPATAERRSGRAFRARDVAARSVGQMGRSFAAGARCTAQDMSCALFLIHRL